MNFGLSAVRMIVVRLPGGIPSIGIQNIQAAEEDWNNKIEAYKEGKFGYYSF